MDLEKKMEFITKTLADVGVTLRNLGKAQARTDRRMRDLHTFVKACLRRPAKPQGESGAKKSARKLR